MEDLKSYLLEGQRKRGTRRTILIIDPYKINDFFKALDESDLTTELKAYIGIGLSGGCRGSETLSIQRSHIQKGRIEGLKVLKKRMEFTSKVTGHILKAEKVYRSFDIHPSTLKYLEILCRDKRRYSKVFSLSLNSVYYQLKIIFGEGFCSHSLRHSHISFRLHVAKQSVQEIEERVKISISTIDSYNHLDTKKKEGLWD
jgi:integrase